MSSLLVILGTDNAQGSGRGGSERLEGRVQ